MVDKNKNQLSQRMVWECRGFRLTRFELLFCPLGAGAKSGIVIGAIGAFVLIMVLIVVIVRGFGNLSFICFAIQNVQFRQTDEIRF